MKGKLILVVFELYWAVCVIVLVCYCIIVFVCFVCLYVCVLLCLFVCLFIYLFVLCSSLIIYVCVCISQIVSIGQVRLYVTDECNYYLLMNLFQLICVYCLLPPFRASTS